MEGRNDIGKLCESHGRMYENMRNGCIRRDGLQIKDRYNGSPHTYRAWKPFVIDKMI